MEVGEKDYRNSKPRGRDRGVPASRIKAMNGSEGVGGIQPKEHGAQTSYPAHDQEKCSWKGEELGRD